MELMRRRPAYLPAWSPDEGRPGWALLRIFSRYMQAVIERLNEAPDKNLLAFLDMLGINLIPAQAAKAPVVFTPLPNLGNGQIAARTRLGAQVPGQSEPSVFETENTIALAAARLVEVKTIWPARDEYADHTVEWAGGRPFTLFGNRRPVPHEFYIAHDTLLAFAGKSTVEIEFELSTPGSESLAIKWEYWDGQVWQSFREFDSTDESGSLDGTDGLKRSGVVMLRAECGQSEKTTVNGIEAYWVRGRLGRPHPPDPARVSAEIDRIRIRTAIDRQLSQWISSEQTIGGDLVVQGTIKDQDGAPLSEITVDLVALGLPALEFMSISTDAAGKFAYTSTSLEPNRTYAMQIVDNALPAFSHRFELGTEAVQIDFIFTRGLELGQAFADGIELDVSKSFFPFGQYPQIGSTFYFTNEEIFDKSGATMTVGLDSALLRDKRHEEDFFATAPKVAWEYWNGKKWVPVVKELIDSQDPDSEEEPQDADGQRDPLQFTEKGRFIIKVPNDMEPVEVNGQEKLWMRVALKRGAYGFQQTLSFGEMGGFVDGEAPPVSAITTVNTVPPVIHDMRLGFSYRSAWERPEHCLTYNDFQYELHTNDVRWPGGFFPPFRPVSDITPALYLGFDQPLPNDLASFYIDIQEEETYTPPLVWEARDGETWEELRTTDETADLQRPSMVSFIAPDVAERPKATITGAIGLEITAEDALQAAVFKTGDLLVVEQDKNRELATVLQVQGALISLETPLSKVYTGGTVSLAPLPRFGTPLDWIRVRMKEDGMPPKRGVNGIHLNAAWASQVQTMENETLGSGTGQTNQALFFNQVPVLPDERIEVRELEGARAEVELPILREELFKQGMTEDDIRPEFDPRDGSIAEVWIRWQYRPHLFFSGPDDRHYTIERASGRLEFGGRGNGRIPTVGPNNIQARLYRSGGGVNGNVAAGQINQLLGPAPFVQEVSNPRAAEGGADGESVVSVRSRGPETIRHQGRALTAHDFEALAREASPGVAAVRALPITAPNLRPTSGWVTVIIVPQSIAPRPQPTFELRRQVHNYLAARAPATLSPERIAVIGPTYLPIGVAATVIPRRIGQAGVVEGRVRAVLERFLHPLTGGPEGCGWPFGRDVFLSDLAAVLEAVDGVDYVRELNLLLNDTPRGEQIEVPPDRIVVAGPLHVEMHAGERIGN